MARGLRIEYPDAAYYVTSEGSAGAGIYRDDDDKRAFLDIVADTAMIYGIVLYGYCLMEANYHLLLEIPLGNLAMAMRLINGRYTQYFNRRHQESGHLFRSRYISVVIEKNDYLLEMCRRMVLIPFWMGTVKSPAKYGWSSYRSIVDRDKDISCLNRDWILSQFASDDRGVQEAFKVFLRKDTNGKREWEKRRGARIFGSPGYVEKVKSYTEDRRKHKDIVEECGHADRPSLEAIFKGVADKAARDRAMHEAFMRYGYKQSEIAEYLGKSYVTVSRIIKHIRALEMRMEKG